MSKFLKGLKEANQRKISDLQQDVADNAAYLGSNTETMATIGGIAAKTALLVNGIIANVRLSGRSAEISQPQDMSKDNAAMGFVESLGLATVAGVSMGLSDYDVAILGFYYATHVLKFQKDINRIEQSAFAESELTEGDQTKAKMLYRAFKEAERIKSSDAISTQEAKVEELQAKLQGTLGEQSELNNELEKELEELRKLKSVPKIEDFSKIPGLYIHKEMQNFFFSAPAKIVKKTRHSVKRLLPAINVIPQKPRLESDDDRMYLAFLNYMVRNITSMNPRSMIVPDGGSEFRTKREALDMIFNAFEVSDDLKSIKQNPEAIVMNQRIEGSYNDIFDRGVSIQAITAARDFIIGSSKNIPTSVASFLSGLGIYKSRKKRKSSSEEESKK
ncbi:MAG: hypothetical protein N4A36_04195 [Candidatus Gracilibacteria bacterium]|jgi:hypothetical protein|nr:hypothetical protein [Candidatus Gracilibacteria bacterium]